MDPTGDIDPIRLNRRNRLLWIQQEELPRFDPVKEANVGHLCNLGYLSSRLLFQRGLWAAPHPSSLAKHSTLVAVHLPSIDGVPGKHTPLLIREA